MTTTHVTIGEVEHRARRVVTVLVTAIVAAGLFGCSSAPSAASSPRAGSRPRPTATHTPTPAAAHSSQAPMITPTPSPPTQPGPSGIPHVTQRLVFSGYVSGTATTAEVKECGPGSNLWGVELSNIALGPSRLSLTLFVQGYSTPGTYPASGAIDLIEQQSLDTFPEVGGQVEISDPTTGTFNNVTFQSSSGQSITVNGKWACAG